MSKIQFILTIAVCAAATMLTRFLPFLVFGSRGGRVPEVVEYLGHVLPAAIFGMLIVYCLKGVSLTAGSHGIPEVIAIGTAALRFQCVTFCLQSWVVMGNMCQQTMGLTVPATFMAVARQGLFFIPTVWILALTLGLPGIQMAQMVADLLTFLCSVPIQTWVLKKLSQPQK